MFQTSEAAPEADGEARGQHSRGRGCWAGDADRPDQVTRVTYVSVSPFSTLDLLRVSIA